MSSGAVKSEPVASSEAPAVREQRDALLEDLAPMLQERCSREHHSKQLQT